MNDANENDTPPWRTETWRCTHGPEGDRRTRWFLARQDDPAMPTLSPQDETASFWSIIEPGTPHFLALTRSPAEGVAYMASVSGAINPVIEKLEPGSPEDLRSENYYLRSRESYFASVLKVADGGQYRADWKAPLQRVLGENKALRAEVDALRDGEAKVAADASGVWVVNRPNEKPTVVAVDSDLRATMLDGSDTGWAKYEDRSGWSWVRVPDAHAATLRVAYSVGYEGGARTMRQNVAARLARMSTDCRSRASGSRGGEAAVFLESDADAYAEAERVVQGLDLPTPGAPRGE